MNLGVLPFFLILVLTLSHGYPTGSIHCTTPAPASVENPTRPRHEEIIDYHVEQFTPDPNPLNVKLLSQLPYEQPTNDIWGYTDPSGREYALIGLQNRTSIVDITNPFQPLERSSIPGVTSIWRDLKTLDHYLYVVSDERNGGLQIIDLSNLPQDASLANTYNGFDRAHNIFIDTQTQVAYILGSNLDQGGIRLLDLSNPTQPAELGSWEDTYCHDIYVDNAIAYAFLGDAGIGIIDVSNPAQPITLNTIVYPGLSYSHSGWATSDQKYLAACDEIDEISDETPTTRVLFFERVGNTFNYNLIGTYQGPNAAIDHNIFLRGNFAHLSNYTYGYTLIDVSDFSNPTLFGHYDTHPHDNGTFFEGAWGVYPYFPSNNVILSDISTGLYVLRPSIRSSVRFDWSNLR